MQRSSRLQLPDTRAGRFLTVASLLLWLPFSSAAADDAYSARINRILAKTPLIDGHNDLPWAYRRYINDSVSARVP